MKAKGYAGYDAVSPLKQYDFERREVGESDVCIDVQYCGICHSDIHSVRSEWGAANYPLVPGHEIVGIVKKVGVKVQRHKVGDVVGVGCLVNACGRCNSCHQHHEQFCEQGAIFTYNSVDEDGSITQGGYSDCIVVNEKFVLSIPPHLKLSEVAPLLCAGITTYSPLKHWKVAAQDKVGVIGLGGLGHMAVKFARSFGAYVVVFTTSPEKKADALRLGANEVVLSKNDKEMDQHLNSFDFILDTVAVPHNLNAYLALLKQDKTLCMLGLSPTPHQIASAAVIQGRKNLSGSLIGGIAETQEMLDYCGKHHITSDIELIPIQQVNQAYERMLKNDVKYRFVIDMASLKNS